MEINWTLRGTVYCNKVKSEVSKLETEIERCICEAANPAWKLLQQVRRGR